VPENLFLYAKLQHVRMRESGVIVPAAQTPTASKNIYDGPKEELLGRMTKTWVPLRFERQISEGLSEAERGYSCVDVPSASLSLSLSLCLSGGQGVCERTYVAGQCTCRAPKAAGLRYGCYECSCARTPCSAPLFSLSLTHSGLSVEESKGLQSRFQRRLHVTTRAGAREGQRAQGGERRQHAQLGWQGTIHLGVVQRPAAPPRLPHTR
jgi:hypothetical protein